MARELLMSNCRSSWSIVMHPSIRILTLAVLSGMALDASVARAGGSEAPRWKADPSLRQIKLRGPFLDLLRDKRKSPDKDAEASGEIEFADAAHPGASKIVPVRIKARGHSAWMEGECDFPKLTLKFEEKSVVGTPFEGLKKVKLGTHCGDASPTTLTEKRRLKNPLAVWREAYAYEVLAQLGIPSLTARPTTVEYEDTTRKRKISRPAFFLDDEDEFAKRRSAEILTYAEMSEAGVKIGKGDLFKDGITDKVSGVPAALLGEAALGNPDVLFKVSPDDDSTDGTSSISNIYVMRTKASGAKIAVPYDFDLAAAVTGHTGLETLGIPAPVGMTSIQDQIRQKIAALVSVTKPAEYRAAALAVRAKRGAAMAALASAPIDPAGRALYADHLNFFFSEIDRTLQ